MCTCKSKATKDLHVEIQHWHNTWTFSLIRYSPNTFQAMRKKTKKRKGLHEGFHVQTTLFSRWPEVFRPSTLQHPSTWDGNFSAIVWALQLVPSQSASYRRVPKNTRFPLCPWRWMFGRCGFYRCMWWPPYMETISLSCDLERNSPAKDQCNKKDVTRGIGSGEWCRGG